MPQPYIKQAQEYSDIVSGWRFSATLQLRTPLQYLRLHGAIHRMEDGDPPDHPIQHGIWVPIPKSNKELGIDLPEVVLSNRTCASEIGQVPADGGDFLKFLIAVKSIAEAEGPEKAISSMLRTELARPRWREFVRALDGADRITGRLMGV